MLDWHGVVVDRLYPDPGRLSSAKHTLRLCLNHYLLQAIADDSTARFQTGFKSV